MAKFYRKKRPSHLVAVYIEPRRVEFLRAHRSWRTWSTGAPEEVALSEGESFFDQLHRLNLHPRGRQATALVLFLARPFYSVHREYYPISLSSQLEETLAYDWSENIFLEQEQTLHFHGPPVPAGDQVLVPVFSMQQEVYDKLYQAFNGERFSSFTIVPSALAYRHFVLSPDQLEGAAVTVQITGRQVDPLHIEANRFLNGLLQDSFLVRKDEGNLRLMAENLLCLRGGDCPEEVSVNLVHAHEECARVPVEEWKSQGLPAEITPVSDSVLSYWVRDLLEKDEEQVFGSQVHLKPWEAPKVVWPVLCLILVYALFAAYKVHERSKLTEALDQLTARRVQLEAQWRPIERLQKRIPILQQGQSTLAQFSQESFPVVGLLSYLSQVTPDDTWLNFLSLKGKELTMRGESRSAIKYLTDLTKVAGFEDVRFASPVSRNPSSDKERFHIQLQLDTEKSKKIVRSIDSEGQSSPATPVNSPQPGNGSVEATPPPAGAP